MNNLSKVIAITAVAAMSFGCLSAYAAEMPGRSRQMPLQPAVAKAESKMDAGIKDGFSNIAFSNNKKANVNVLGNNIHSQFVPGDIGDRTIEKPVEIIKPEKMESKRNVVRDINTKDIKIGNKNGKTMKAEKPEKVEMTEEEKTAKIEELKADLTAKLEAGDITQEEYDKAIAAIESGDFIPGGRDGKGMKAEKPEKIEMTEEEKAAKIEELKADLTAKLEAEEITQEEYDKAIAAIESGEFMPGGRDGKGMKNDKHKVPKVNEQSSNVEAATEL